MKVLLVKLSALGDVVQALPVAMAIRRQNPEAQVDWLVEKPSAPLLAGHPALSRVLVSPRHEITQGDGNIFTALTGFGRELRSVTYDAVLDLQGLMKSAMLVALCKAERKIGFKGGKEPLAAWPLTERLAPYDPDRHALERYLDLLEPLGIMRPAHPQFGLEPGPEALDGIEALLGQDRGGGPFVILHPVAKWESKLWPVAHWAKLARDLKALGLRVALSGSADDRGVTRAIAAGAGVDLIDLAGRFSLKQMAALLSKADLLVSTDTGVMHLAAAMGCPVVALFGPTAPWRTGPYGAGHRVLSLKLACAPCFRRECEKPRCLTELSPEQVLAEAQEALART
ncbi:hypothetical protein AAU61_14715 [Desulfocarbo indianensis]|nr:hypothetical protein AAU61_14715 [Desulfocarbo indianensis]